MYKIVSRIQLTVSGEQRNGSSVLASTAGTTNTVDVVLRVVRVIVVQHMGDVANIFGLQKKKGLAHEIRVCIATSSAEREETAIMIHRPSVLHSLVNQGQSKCVFSKCQSILFAGGHIM